MTRFRLVIQVVTISANWSLLGTLIRSIFKQTEIFMCFISSNLVV